jgi:hypothetical protein
MNDECAISDGKGGNRQPELVSAWNLHCPTNSPSDGITANGYDAMGCRTRTYFQLGLFNSCRNRIGAG